MLTGNTIHVHVKIPKFIVKIMNEKILKWGDDNGMEWNDDMKKRKTDDYGLYDMKLFMEKRKAIWLKVFNSIGIVLNVSWRYSNFSNCEGRENLHRWAHSKLLGPDK